jgi:hypothetical protein
MRELEDRELRRNILGADDLQNAPHMSILDMLRRYNADLEAERVENHEAEEHREDYFEEDFYEE